MRKQRRTAAVLLSCTLGLTLGAGHAVPAGAEGEDRTDSEAYTEARADYWAARAAYAARKAATQARKEAERNGEVYVAEEAAADEGGGEAEVAPVSAAPAARAEGYPTNSQLAALRMCESTDDYFINTGNGYYGGYQFSAVTWWWLGYSGYPHHAEPWVQDQAVRDLYAIYGWSPWPACSQYLGFA